MKKIKITDKTLTGISGVLSFREKTEIAKQLDKLGADVIELPQIKSDKADIILVKNIAGVVEKAALSIPAGFTKETADLAFSAVKDAKIPVLNVVLPMSPAGMEYHCALKPDKMLLKINEMVAHCVSLCGNVEFTAADATRAEKEFLVKALTEAIGAGAKSITVCDDAGITDPAEFADFITYINENVQGIENVSVSVDVCDAINMSTACIAAALRNNADGIKTTVGSLGYADIEKIAAFLSVKGDVLGVLSGIKTATLKNVCDTINSIIESDRTKQSPYDGVIRNDDEIELHKNDDFATVAQAVRKIGYDLNAEDSAKVYEEFRKISEEKEYFGTKELEAIIASSALQVPSTYHLVSYVINSGNVITATANLCIEKDGKKLNGVYVGDGPIDAAFLAIEQVVGHHFELDDFQIQSVTEGREAMGQALVKLRSDSGKLYSGSGISTDVIGASIKAYLNALNKIAFEENR